MTEQMEKIMLSHVDRLALLGALVAWRNNRQERLQPTRLNDPKEIAAIVYAPRETALGVWK